MTPEQTLMELARTSDRLGEYAQEVSTESPTEDDMNALRELGRNADRLSDLADKYYDDDERHPDSVSSLLRKASFAVEDAREALKQQTRKAVAEVVNIAWRQNGGEGVVESHILREKAA